MGKYDLDEKAVFGAAIELAGSGAVEAYLEVACAARPKLRQRVEHLLGLMNQAEEFFQFNALPGGALASLLETESFLPNGSACQDLSAPFRIGDYQLLEEIGRGGMGVVYKARQVSLDRIVAVKLLLWGALASNGFIQRFRLEASAAAQLRHPNIVAVHEVGTYEGQHYLAMDYIAGPTLAELTRSQPLAPRRATAYVRSIAEAIHFAHEQGILHRDLKPSNVLIDQYDQPHLTDFGLAKRLDADMDLTLSGQVLGSPGYMSPEQAGGRRSEMGHSSDIYSLGAILYYLLTGRAPFVAESVGETIRIVIETEPIAPRALVPDLPRDLETICLKCLQKEPSQRYATANELALEFGRFLNNEPIQARRASRVERAWRWCLRRPALATVGAVATALLTFVVIGSPVAVYRINEARLRAERKTREAQHNLYVANMNLARQAWDENNLERLRQVLDATAIDPERGFEWYYWQRQMHLAAKTIKAHSNAIVAVAWSPDGRRFVTGSWDHTAKVWDASSDHELISVDWQGGRVNSVGFSPDGRWIISGHEDHTAKVWDAESGRLLRTLSGHSNEVYASIFSPDGRKIATASKDGTARIFYATGTAETLILRGHAGPVSSVAFSPDGRRIVTGGGDM